MATNKYFEKKKKKSIYKLKPNNFVSILQNALYASVELKWHIKK